MSHDLPAEANPRPRLRDTNDWYETKDPLSVVDWSLVEAVHGHAGSAVLDVGCGLGGYSAALKGLGHTCVGVDINPRYVETACGIGVDARVYDGLRLPFANRSFQTSFAIEVLEHVPDPGSLVAEAARVSSDGFLATVPNCSQDFGGAGVVFDHMLDADHRNFFTRESLARLLRPFFAEVDVREIVPVNAELARVLLPRPAARVYRYLLRQGWLRPTHYFRLLARCSRPHQSGGSSA